ncbi:MAG: hypothetical protein M1816_005285 [Peltula sp. TS41687]|nr:MAG: hypothetical protein M1816_005285 [Peltula sp. TS41687]
MDEPPRDEVPPGPARVNSGRRDRAPMITIDTSAASTTPATETIAFPDLSASDTRMYGEGTTDDVSPHQSINPSLPRGNNLTYEGGEWRPTSPHNVSSPTTKSNDQFLAVPGARSRGNSADSEDSPSQVSIGGETVLASPAASSQDDSQIRNLATAPTTEHILNDEEALHPDPGTEADFEVVNNKFAVSPGQLGKLFNPKSLAALYALGGLDGLEKGLRTDCQSGLSMEEGHLDGTISLQDIKGHSGSSEQMNGLSHSAPARSDTKATGTTNKVGSDSFPDRKRVFGENRLPEKKVKNIFQLAWIAYNDKVLILLTIAAVVSLALGLYQTFGRPHPDGEARIEWVEGVAIMVAIIIVVVVGAINDWQKERQFVKLNRKKEDRTVKLIRSGKTQEISVYDILVGDLMLLEPGDLIPVDGILVQGHGVKCDESSATGESDIMKKVGGGEVYKALEAHQNAHKLDPFILSGAKVTEGIGKFLVTGVGTHSVYGKTMVSLREDIEATPLQSKLNVLAEQIAKLGGAAALLLFIILFIKFLVQLRGNTASPSDKAQNFLQIFIVAVTIVVVAVPEGLPLAVTLALAFATTRMLKDNNLVRVLRACETMGNATTVCSDKTGTLTQNKMTVVAGSIGTTSRFGDKASGSAESKAQQAGFEDEKDDSSPRALVSTLPEDVKIILKQSIVINSTAFEGLEDGKPAFIGSKTETALLNLARDYLGIESVSIERANANVVQFVPFDSGRKCMASVVKLDNGMFRMYVKGASEIMLGKCSKIISEPTYGIDQNPMTPEKFETLNDIINTYASRSLRTIGFVYRDYEQWPPRGAKLSADDPTKADFDSIFSDMVFLAVVGIQDPLREGVPEAVKQCQKAGVFVRMVTGDNVATARAIAEDCGILTPGGLVMEGPSFRKQSKLQMERTVPRLQVLARSSPEDKRILVRKLKEMGETVAVTGDGTNDAPALKTADVGFSMGIAGTEVAKEASSIILMDDNFSSIVKAIMWGRAVNDAVKKFLQFQLTVNITAVVLAFVSAVSDPNEESVLKAVQLLWVNLIMDTFAALALATDPPSPSILDRKPDRKSAPLITVTMWKMIIGQAIYQLAVTFILYFGGSKILSYDSDAEKDKLPTLVFNTFVWMQIFNQLNNRRLDNKFNIFEGLQRNYFFMIIALIMVGGQVLIIFVGGRAFQVKPLNGAQWGISILLGAISIPMAVIIRLIPDEAVRRILPSRMHRQKTPQLVVSDDDHRFEWNQGLEGIREELAFFKTLRGGRMRDLRSKLKHPREILLPRSGSRSRSSSILQTPNGESYGGGAGAGGAEMGSMMHNHPSEKSHRNSRSRSNSAFGPAAAMAGVVAGSIAGWSPIDRTHGDRESFGSYGGDRRSEVDGAADGGREKRGGVPAMASTTTPAVTRDDDASGISSLNQVVGGSYHRRELSADATATTSTSSEKV